MPVQIYCRKNSPVNLPLLEKCLSALMVYTKKSRAFLEIQLVGKKRMQALNAQFRAKDQVTDVLSFPQDVTAPFKSAPWLLGEIVIATAVAKQQARRANRSLDFQMIRLAIHGFVHLEGLDHEKNHKEKWLFEKRETQYLSFLNKKGWMTWDGSLQL